MEDGANDVPNQYGNVVHEENEGQKTACGRTFDAMAKALHGTPSIDETVVVKDGAFKSNIGVVPKKVELLIRLFEPFWISRVFHFSLGTFGEVGDLPDPFGASDETCTQSKIDISGSNETMQNALASIVWVWRIFEIFFMF